MKTSLLLLCLTLVACKGTTGELFPGDLSPSIDAALPDMVNPALVPVPVIFHPSDNETRAAGVAIPFVGHASDPTDGALTGASLVWSSDRDGVIGTGENFSAPLTQNTHRVTLTATNSLGLKGSVFITLIVN